MTIQKVPGRCATTLPAGTAHERPLSVTRSAAFFAPPRLPPGRGLRLCYSRDEARSIRQRIVSSARRTRRLMRPTPLPASGSLRRAGRMEETAQQAFSNAPGAARQAAARRWGVIIFAPSFFELSRRRPLAIFPESGQGLGTVLVTPKLGGNATRKHGFFCALYPLSSFFLTGFSAMFAFSDAGCCRYVQAARLKAASRS